MLPALLTLAAPGTWVKWLRPARKSALLRLRVEATSPATSTVAPAPKTMPPGLMRNTRPLDCSVPRILEGLLLMTRLSTEDEALCWTKRVISFAPIEKPCQLMMVPGVLVTLRVLPVVAKLA